jgi:hypothetical protein
MTSPDPTLLEGVVADRVLEAMRKASAALARAGVRHVVAGGLAVGANGYPRATKDVDFLVGDEAFERHEGGLVTLRAGVPIQVDGVAIDFLSAATGEAHLDAALAAPAGSMLEAPPLVYLKLKSPRLKDLTDVVELIKAGMDVEACRRYMAAHAPGLSPRFEDAVRTAAAEDE